MNITVSPEKSRDGGVIFECKPMGPDELFDAVESSMEVAASYHHYGEITGGVATAAAFAVLKSDPGMADSCWVGNSGDWARGVGCDSDSMGDNEMDIMVKSPFINHVVDMAECIAVTVERDVNRMPGHQADDETSTSGVYDADIDYTDKPMAMKTNKSGDPHRSRQSKLRR